MNRTREEWSKVKPETTFIAELNQGDDWRIFGTNIVIVNPDKPPRQISLDEFFIESETDNVG